MSTFTPTPTRDFTWHQGSDPVVTGYPAWRATADLNFVGPVEAIIRHGRDFANEDGFSWEVTRSDGTPLLGGYVPGDVTDATLATQDAADDLMTEWLDDLMGADHDPHPVDCYGGHAVSD